MAGPSGQNFFLKDAPPRFGFDYRPAQLDILVKVRWFFNWSRLTDFRGRSIALNWTCKKKRSASLWIGLKAGNDLFIWACFSKSSWTFQCSVPFISYQI
jgi:hypothetical protein